SGAMFRPDVREPIRALEGVLILGLDALRRKPVWTFPAELCDEISNRRAEALGLSADDYR
ncbi:MAG: hypothetical protein VCB43_00840, partial [Myxococcota bacterium]